MHVERLEQHRQRRGRAVVTVEVTPDPDRWDALWELYRDAFEPLQERALLNHLYPRSSFEELLGDPRVSKLIAWEHRRPVGLAMVTSHLDVVPQISPAFLRARYPEEAARSAVFFGIMLFVDSSHRRSSVFARLVAGMGQLTADRGGVIVFDICRHNLESIELDRQLNAVARWFPGSSFSEIDQQSYFAVNLPLQIDRQLSVTLPAPSTVSMPNVFEVPAARQHPTIPPLDAIVAGD